MPKALAEPIKHLLRDRTGSPELSAETGERLREIFNADLAQLGDWVGMELDCDNFQAAATEHPMEWA